MKPIHLLFALGLALAAAQAPHAQGSWPERPVHIVVPQPPGGPSDIVLRSAIEKMQPILKQPLIVDNKPGAAGNLGAIEVARAAPDGQTWLWTTDTLLTVNPNVYPKLGFKPEDLVPVMRASAFSQTLVCNPGLGLKTVADLVRRAKSRPMSYASGGAGSPGHLSSELFKNVAGIEMTHIPYKGPAPAMQDVMGGQVDCGFLAGPTVLPQVRAGKLVALAVSGAQRSPLLPDVPTVAEAGYPRFDATFSLVLFAPKGTPKPIVDTMFKALDAALKDPGVAERLRQSDQAVVADSPGDSAARLAADARTWGAVVKRIGLQLD
ncbi:Bug family tripartite tricarboxylate transporter substrate binding protein [Variovorax sp. PBL-E5]|uniref:Bug family tripartite tricarboxylate transporter substrate binding protein n=1 Tax=Variovorax sp. PBL-E5 TaxID=434014 RepID=UPI00131844A7|nr:tripartite tricarboxylate transporter substrate binding protein [Variovorax sp. PBL-E5]VTU36788.1 Argininosuccinate lyase [Variovorax sp. PBL-E5]